MFWYNVREGLNLGPFDFGNSPAPHQFFYEGGDGRGPIPSGIYDVGGDGGVLAKHLSSTSPTIQRLSLAAQRQS